MSGRNLRIPKIQQDLFSAPAGIGPIELQEHWSPRRYVNADGE